MSYASLAQQTRDNEFRMRVSAACQKLVATDDTYAQTDFGRAVKNGIVGTSNYVMMPVSVETEAAYEAAISGTKPNPNPGGDPAVISDEAILAAVQKLWPANPWPPLQEIP